MSEKSAIFLPRVSDYFHFHFTNPCTVLSVDSSRLAAHSHRCRTDHLRDPRRHNRVACATLPGAHKTTTDEIDTGSRQWHTWVYLDPETAFIYIRITSKRSITALSLNYLLWEWYDSKNTRVRFPKKGVSKCKKSWLLKLRIKVSKLDDCLSIFLSRKWDERFYFYVTWKSRIFHGVGTLRVVSKE